MDYTGEFFIFSASGTSGYISPIGRHMLSQVWWLAEPFDSRCEAVIWSDTPRIRRLRLTFNLLLRAASCPDVHIIGINHDRIPLETRAMNLSVRVRCASKLFDSEL